MKVLDVKESAEFIRVRESTVRDPKWRQRVGLPAVRIGRRMLFREQDLLALVERGLEKDECVQGADK